LVPSRVLANRFVVHGGSFRTRAPLRASLRDIRRFGQIRLNLRKERVQALSVPASVAGIAGTVYGYDLR
jgi:hypothetical protein